MSYIALARKYRPKTFANMCGQEHAIESIKNALDNNKVHHAYLITGTRGVGKTTLARLIAKSLNCEISVSSTPCQKCPTCIEITQGTFIDVIEIDAASKTKVEDTKELLDNVQYMPTKGRFKVYIIDEVHMLSKHSFNSLLKTIEEPPEHVKFIFATTDPQKLPITILSRCLQVHLKNLTESEIITQIKKVLLSENIEYEDKAISIISKQADGSMRDALSLLEQVIMHSNNQNLCMDDVLTTLQQTDYSLVVASAKHIINKEFHELMNISIKLNEGNKNITHFLTSLSTLWHSIAIYHTTKYLLPEQSSNKDDIIALSKAIPPEELQILYEISIKSTADLGLSPNEKIGLEMALLRMATFTSTKITKNTNSSPKKTATTTHPIQTKKQVETTIPTNSQQYKHNPNETDFNWNNIVSKLSLNGVSKQIVLNSTLINYNSNIITIFVDIAFQQLVSDTIKQKIENSLRETVNSKIKLNISNTPPGSEKKKILTPAEQEKLSRKQNIQEKYRLITNNSNIKIICDKFKTSVGLNSIITPINPKK